MSKRNSKLDYPLPGKPNDGEMLEIAPGVRWLRMPLPFVLNHINLWLLQDAPGWSIVDTGIAAAETREIWSAVLDKQLQGQPIQRVLVTHLHPDHVGLAGWLCERCGVDLWMSRQEYLSARMLASDQPPPPEIALDFYRAAGFTEAQLDQYSERFGRYGNLLSALPESYHRLQDGQQLQIGQHQWEVVMGRGHSPEHACLYCAELNLLIAGDQALPTISPNVSVWPTEPAADPLGDWLESCRRLTDRVAADVLVLPAHGRPYRGLRMRLDQLLTEHEDGLQKILAQCVRPSRAVDLFDALFRGLIGDGNRIMAAGEAVAHLNYLQQRGQLSASLDADGIRWYRTTSRS
jgi:glyoxylase-like metal-dependent hydrolase (beta-lactamase superfamily II)